ncbi:MAG TPA: DUF885 domain-containing protein [Bryobacteraceae bacterium]|jgi:uncharacterized protein (DUF885 family)|nr:DUF885 domain-containing protein [Bryobacteraceae bacterium]
MLRLVSCAGLLAVILTGCAPRPTPFEQATEDFVYSSLALSPVSATSEGYHNHQGVHLDDLLDDYSPEGIARTRSFLTGARGRLQSFPQEALSPEERADYQIMDDQISLSLLELDSIQNYRHNPTVYVELIGNALFTPYVLNYAPKADRFLNIARRMEAIPRLLDQAKANLVDAPEVWNRVAREENQGNISLIDDTLRHDVPADVRPFFEHAAGPALAALREFDGWLANTLSQKTSDWRLGREKYAQKFRYTLASGKTPEQVLAEAEAQLKATREEMARLAAPKTVREALDEIAQQHATPGTYFKEAKEDLERARQFVEARGLVPLPSGESLQVIPTPEFMRGAYGVGGFSAAPVLEPQLGAFYWITPIPKNASRESVESRLREYNTFGLEHLTIHEAMPGHWVQFQYANRVQPTGRRLLRAWFGNGPYVEGWAVYAQQFMTEEGYLNGAPGMKLTLKKQMLRVLANTILDIRLQTMGMTDQQALDLMTGETYQEKEEATGKLQRAQLSSCQLPMYFIGVSGWNRVRDNDRRRKGVAFQLADFHKRALEEGAVPLPLLDELLR